MSIWLQKSASIQQRTSLLKFEDLTTDFADDNLYHMPSLLSGSSLFFPSVGKDKRKSRDACPKYQIRRARLLHDQNRLKLQVDTYGKGESYSRADVDERFADLKDEHRDE